MGQIIKYNLIKSDGDARNTTVISSGSHVEVAPTDANSIDCELWGQRFRGNDINGTMRIYGDIFLDVDEDSDVDDEEVNENPQLDDDEEEITGTLYGNVKGGNLEGENVTVNKHLYVNHSHDKHEGEKFCLISEVENNTNNIKTNTDNIKKNADSIDVMDYNMSLMETSIRNNANEIAQIKKQFTNIEKLISDNKKLIDAIDANILIMEASIRNNADEIVKLKQDLDFLKS